MSRPHHRRGFSLIELICVIAIIGILIAMLLPAVQMVREQSRSLSCSNKLRQVSIAALSFESTHGNLPPGTLGFKELLYVSDTTPLDDWTSNPASPVYFARAQHTSSLALLLPLLEISALYDSLPSEMTNVDLLYSGDGNPLPDPNWIGEFTSAQTAMTTHLPLFYCPSDSLRFDSRLADVYVASQPDFHDTILGGYDEIAIFPPDGLAGTGVAGTNYFACSGAHSGGDQPLPELKGYAGMMACRTGLETAAVKDGMSNTIMYGESLGEITNRKREGFFPWCFGGLVRGRGMLPWRQNENPAFPDHLLFGDLHYSHLRAFGSAHPQTTNFSLGDGSVHKVDRLIDLDSFYSLCGASDGDLIDFEW